MANTTLNPLGEIRYQGLDVSACTGAIDFAAVRESGRAAVYIRASVADDYIDPALDANYIAARENGLLTGFYHVLTARAPEQARAQARFFAAAVAGREMQLRPAMDFDYLAGLTPAAANAIALAFLETLESELGSGAVVCTDAARAQNLWNAQIAARYPLWLVGCGATAGSWQGWSGWRYAVGCPEGVSGRAGLDRFTDGVLVPAQTEADAAPEAVPTLAAVATTYTVQRNDNLTEIAARFGTTVSELVRLNNIQNPNLIYPGQVLVIREGGSVTPPTGATTYTVQRGDTLSEIAERFGTTVSELVRLNSIADRDRIYPGQVLLLPQNGCVDTYIVQRGDTLSEIAERFGTTVARLAGINGIRNADRIYVGQVLFLGIC